MAPVVNVSSPPSVEFSRRSEGVVSSGSTDLATQNPPVDRLVKPNDSTLTDSVTLSEASRDHSGSVEPNARPSAPGISVQVGTNDAPSGNGGVQFGRRELGLSVTQLGPVSAPLSHDTSRAAQSALPTLNQALEQVNTYRSSYGAVQNRLESAVRNLSNYTENLSSARSRIVDAGSAQDTAQLAKFQILQQGGGAVLGQANSTNHAVLRLLG